MLDLKLSALYLKSARFQDAFLVAHFKNPEEFEAGGYSADLLGYFGFGQGIYRRDPGSPPDWAFRYRFSQFPHFNKRLNDLQERMSYKAAKTVLFTEVVQWFQGLLGYYAYHNIHFAIPDLRMFIDMVASYLNLPLSPDVRTDLVGPDAPPDKNVAESVAMFEVTEDRDIVVGFGGPRFEQTLDTDFEFFDLKEDNHRFDWLHSSQLGTPSNLIRVLNSMKAYNFSADTREEQAKKVDFIIEHLEKVRRAV